MIRLEFKHICMQNIQFYVTYLEQLPTICPPQRRKRHFSTYEYWQKANIFGLPTSYPPHLVIVVCQRPLQQIEVSGLWSQVFSEI